MWVLLQRELCHGKRRDLYTWETVQKEGVNTGRTAIYQPRREAWNTYFPHSQRKEPSLTHSVDFGFQDWGDTFLLFKTQLGELC